MTILSRNGSFNFHRNSIERAKHWTQTFRVYVESIYWVSSLCHFSWDDLILFKYWQPLLETFFWHFDVNFVQQVFSDIGCQLRMNVLCPLDLQDSYHYYGTSETYCLLTSGSFTLCSVHIGSYLWGIMTKLELFKKKKSFFLFYYFFFSGLDVGKRKKFFLINWI